MRFLYGDSAPFPLNYNFLATLEVFMTSATRIVQLESDARESAVRAEEMGNARIKGLEALEQFHNVVMRAVQETAQKVQHVHALEYARQVAGFASSYVDEHRRTASTTNEREHAQVRGDNDRRVQEQRTQLETFLRAARLPVLASRISMQLVVEGKDAQNTMSAIFDNPDGIQTAFAVGTSRSSTWSMPRRVGELAPGIELSVGVDKSWLRGTVTPKLVSVDDWVITQFDLSDQTFGLTIRRKLTERETLHFELRRTEQGITGTVEHPNATNAEALDGQLASSDAASLDRLWVAIASASLDVLDSKEQLLTVSLDGTPVFEGGLVIPFVVRLVAMFAPTVQEIAKRSPNEFELSLKQEHDGGRREEVYLKKEQLVSRLQPLSSVGREVFAPLGLDTWVPGVTSVPPAVLPARSVAPPMIAGAVAPVLSPGSSSTSPGVAPPPPSAAALPSASPSVVPAAPGSSRSLPQS
ncbi:MAG: hypothetical protein JWP97_3232 [Labilithrix sp.]|nr:hypothetical protein [Labilithrix sp.]